MARRIVGFRVLSSVVALCLLATAGMAGWMLVWHWPAIVGDAPEQPPAAPAATVDAGKLPVRLSPQARKNLGLASRPVRFGTYWRRLDFPGLVVDRPGVSDRGVVAPIAGRVADIHAFPGDTVAPDAPLVTLRLVSPPLHAAQVELFKSLTEIELARRQRERLAGLAQSGAVAQSRIIEIDQQVERWQAAAEAQRRFLASQGLADDHVAAAERGQFVTELVIRAPSDPPRAGREPIAAPASEAVSTRNGAEAPFQFEVQSLDVQLGEHVEPGAVLCHLADHRALLVEGRGFAADMPLVHRAARNGWEVDLEFETDDADDWGAAPPRLRIQHVANTVDAETHTFAFYLPLTNFWQEFDQGAARRLLWRYRPGARLRLRAPVQRIDDVCVVPREAVVHEGPEAYVFRQNGDLFERLPVHVVAGDRTHVALANDGSLRAGTFIAQGSAAALLRAHKSQAGADVPAGYHVHADGSVHGPH